MKQPFRGTVLLACLACFALGSLSGGLALRGRAVEPPPQKEKVNVLSMETRIGANLYLQTSGEYRACCLQIYKLATQRLEGVVHSIPFDKPAVIMDLDETVLDNSAFQTFLYKNKLDFSEALWEEFEEKHPREVTLVPGAADFIRKAISLKVKVVFISNRSETFRKATEIILAGELGMQPGADLYLRAKDGSHDKSVRREAVAAKYNIVMVFGDSLRDFSEAFKAKPPEGSASTDDYVKAIDKRLAQVDEAKCHWGIDWFVLPNPVYGEWEKLLGPDPRAVMHPTAMKAP